MSAQERTLTSVVSFFWHIQEANVTEKRSTDLYEQEGDKKIIFDVDDVDE